MVEPAQYTFQTQRVTRVELILASLRSRELPKQGCLRVEADTQSIILSTRRGGAATTSLNEKHLDTPTTSTSLKMKQVPATRMVADVGNAPPLFERRGLQGSNRAHRIV